MIENLKTQILLLKLDTQSLGGKVAIGVSQKAKKQKVPVIAVVGDISDDIDEVYDKGISAVMSINRFAMPFSEAKLCSKKDLQLTINTIMKLYTVFNEIK